MYENAFLRVRCCIKFCFNCQMELDKRDKNLAIHRCFFLLLPVVSNRFRSEHVRENVFLHWTVQQGVFDNPLVFPFIDSFPHSWGTTNYQLPMTNKSAHNKPMHTLRFCLSSWFRKCKNIHSDWLNTMLTCEQACSQN